MILIKILIGLFGAYIFFQVTSLFLNWIRSVYNKWKDAEKESIHIIKYAGEEVNKFDVDTCFVIEDWEFIRDLPLDDRIPIHKLVDCLDEYNVHYIYMADKEGKNLIHLAVGRDFKSAKIELEKIH
jgi:hypothetical protein